MCASAVVSPVAAKPVAAQKGILTNKDFADLELVSSVRSMKIAIKKCDYDLWAGAKRDYDTPLGSGNLTPPAAPSYPIPCTPEARKLRTTNIRNPPSSEPVRLYQAIPRRDYKRTEPPPEERTEIGARIGGPRTEAVSFTGFYLGGDVAGLYQGFSFLGPVIRKK
jgi:hypothetical protein